MDETNSDIRWQRQIFVPLNFNEDQPVPRKAWKTNKGHLVYTGQCKRGIDENPKSSTKRSKNPI